MSKTKKRKLGEGKASSGAASGGTASNGAAGGGAAAASPAKDKPGLPLWSSLSEAWQNRLLNFGKRFGVYFLFFFGIYWILAAWFSSWGEGWLAKIALHLLGGGLIYLAWYLTAPEADTEAKKNRERETREELLALAQANMKHGAIWCLGGLLVTAISYLIAVPGGTYIVTGGAILFGASQFLQGYAQMQRATKKS